MTRFVPEAVSGPTVSYKPGPADSTYCCVDCALAGAPAALVAVYTVNGTTLCQFHAVAARNRETA